MEQEVLDEMEKHFSQMEKRENQLYERLYKRKSDRPRPSTSHATLVHPEKRSKLIPPDTAESDFLNAFL